MIKLNDVSVTFESEGRIVPAVKNVNLHIERGDIYGIVGYSGAGKSTLVRTMNLLQRPTSGQVIVNDQDLTTLTSRQLRAARKKIGMIFQHFNLMEQRTIGENVAYPLKWSGISKKERQERVIELLDLVGLSDKLNDYPSQLSGGQKQRVAIARALANDPDILLADESTSALDPKTTTSILQLLKSLNEKLGLTLVVITHEMSVVKDICNKVAVMEEGVVLEEGSLLEIFTQPKKALTKEFINTATHFDQEMQIVLNHPSIESLKDQGQLVRLSYVGDVTTEPLVASVVQQFNVVVNILYGSVEILQDQPVGNLFMNFQGDPEAIEAAFDYLKSQSIQVTTIDDLLIEYAYREDVQEVRK